MLCYRYSAIDCERETINRDIIEARQNFLPEPHKSLEYEIHGEFKFSENKRSIHDTYHFSLDELHERGMKKSKFKLAWSKYKNMVADDVDEDMDILPDSDEEGEGEGDGAEDVDEEETGPIGGRGGRGRGGSRVVSDGEDAAAPVVAAAHTTAAPVVASAHATAAEGGEVEEEEEEAEEPRQRNLGRGLGQKGEGWGEGEGGG